MLLCELGSTEKYSKSDMMMMVIVAELASIPGRILIGLKLRLLLNSLQLQSCNSVGDLGLLSHVALRMCTGCTDWNEYLEVELARVSRRTPSDIKVRQVKGRVVTHKQNKTDSN